MPVSGDEVETCPDCGCPQQEWRSRKHVSTCPRAVTKDRDADGLRRLIRACLRELEPEREALDAAVNTLDTEAEEWRHKASLEGTPSIEDVSEDELEPMLTEERCLEMAEWDEEWAETLQRLLPETEGEDGARD